MDKQYNKAKNTVLSRIKLACAGRVHNKKLTGSQVLGQYFDFFNSTVEQEDKEGSQEDMADSCQHFLFS